MTTPSKLESPEKGLFFKTGLVSFWTFISRIFGLIRDVVTTSLLGSSLAHDVFVVMLKIPNVFRRLVAEGAFNQAFVPVLTEYKNLNSFEETKEVINKSFTFIFLASGILVGLVFIFTPIFVFIFAPGFFYDESKLALSQNILRITFPYLFFISLVALSGSILNTFNKFSVPAATPIFFNLSIILCAIYLRDYFENPVFALAYGVIIAGIVQLAFQIKFLLDLKLLPRLDLKILNKGTKKIFNLMIPGILAGGVVQLNILIDTIFASLLETGSPTWLYLSDRLIQLPLGIFGIAIATVILPKLSGEYVAEKYLEFKENLRWGIELILIFAIPSSIALFCLGLPIIELLFVRGNFNESDAIMTAMSLQAFSFGLFAFMLIKVLSASFFARQDTFTPLIITILSFVMNVFLNYFLAFYLGYGHVGLALGSSIAAIVSVVIYYLILSRNSFIEVTKESLISIIKILSANIVFYLVINFFANNISAINDQWLSNLVLLFGILFLIIFYFLTLYLFGFRASFFRR